MTTDKLTPTHPLIQSLTGCSPHLLPSPTQASVTGSVSAHTGHTTRSDLTFLSPRRQPPEGPSGQVSHRLGFSTGVLSMSNVTLALLIKHDSLCHLHSVPLYFTVGVIACFYIYFFIFLMNTYMKMYVFFLY